MLIKQRAKVLGVNEMTFVNWEKGEQISNLIRNASLEKCDLIKTSLGNFSVNLFYLTIQL